MPKNNHSKFWQIRNQTDTSVEILIYGPIADEVWWGDEITPKQFAEDLKALGPVKEIILRLNSPGGSVFAGQAIHSMLKRHAANVTVYIDGLAASIASVIAMAGDRVIMPAGAMLMIHNPMVGILGYYEAAEMREMADYLDKVRECIIAVYEMKTGMERDKLVELMDAETWMTAAEAVKYGFADEIEGQQIAASIANDSLTINGMTFDLSKFIHRPTVAHMAKNLPATPVLNDQKEDEQVDFETLKNQYPDLFNQIRNEGVLAERNRMKALDTLALPGNSARQEIINKARYETGASAEQVAIEIVTAENALRTKVLNDRTLDAQESGAGDVPPAAPPNEDAEISNMAKAIAAGANERRK